MIASVADSRLSKNDIMAQTERKEGYYWVRLGKEWLCARWSAACNGYWTIPLVDNKLKDSAFLEINETRIPSPDDDKGIWDKETFLKSIK